jgi:hypothetical protein
MTISLLPRGRKRGRHQFDPDTAATIADDLRELPDVPQPDPLRDTGEIPVLADAQRALLEQRAIPVPERPKAATLQRVAAGLRKLDAPNGTHPFAAQVTGPRPAQPKPPRIRPLPRAIPMASPQVRERRAEAAEARLDTLTYPACDGTATGGDYAEVLRRIGRITGTTTRFEQPDAWAMPIGRAA